MRRTARPSKLFLPLLFPLISSCVLGVPLQFSQKTTVDSSFAGVWDVSVGDMDRDGYPDILGAAYTAGDLAWWENPGGSGLSWTKHTVTDSFDGAFTSYPADLDRDGDLDVLGAANWADAIQWWENLDGRGGSWALRVVDDDFIGASCAVAADADGDGDLDVFGASWYADTVAWWENLDGQGTSWSKMILSDSFTEVRSMVPEDLDQDGDVDVLGAAFGGDDVAWWENVQGDGSSWSFHSVDADFWGARSVVASDVDSDGDKDILAAAWYGNEVAWYENLNGDASVWQKRSVATDLTSARAVASSDLDRDGDLDILAVAYYPYDVVWYENLDVQGHVWSMQTIDGNFAGACDVLASDVNRDGKEDVVAAGWIAGAIGWWQNQGPLPTPTPTASPTSLTPTPTVTPTPLWQPTGSLETHASSPVSGLVLYGNTALQDMAGMPASASLSTSHVLPHFQSDTRWYTGITVSNPVGPDDAVVTLTAYGTTGNILGTAWFGVPLHGRVSKLVSDPSLLGPGAGTGWIELSSSESVMVSEVYGDTHCGGIAGLISTESSPTLILPHFHCSNRWWTGIAVANPEASSLPVTLTAYATDGTLLDQTAHILPAKGKWSGIVDREFAVSAGQSGWIKVEALGGSVAGLLVYGDRTASPQRIAALSSAPVRTTWSFSDVPFTAEQWTGISLVNPDQTQTAQVTLSYYAPDGGLLDTQAVSVLPRCKTTRLASTLFALSSPTEGWVAVQSDLPITGLQVLGFDDPTNSAWGLAAVEPQLSSAQLFVPHYDIRSPWWTRLALANPDPVSPVQPDLIAFDAEGDVAAVAQPILVPHGRISESLKTLLGVLKR